MAASSREWPASSSSMAAAREFLKDCALRKRRTLLLPDKDADGLCASLIVYRALVALGLSRSLISVHFVAKGSNIHTLEEKRRIEAYGTDAVIAVDQGSRGGGPIASGERVRTMVIDHHWSEEFPENALVLSAAKHPPVATSSTLAYLLCRPLHPSIQAKTDYLCAIGTFGDLGTSMKWDHPWPEEEMKACVKMYGKKVLSDAVGLVNAPRRTATYDVHSAWEALLNCIHPKSIAIAPRLLAARSEVQAETNRCARNRPWFSGDGRIALIRVTSGAQIHPVIATRWANSLKSSKLEVVMCANDGYLPDMTNFSCRVAKCARGRVRSSTMKTDDEEREEESASVNIIEILVEYAEKVPGLRDAMGDNFARGHKEASGGIVLTEHFEKLWSAMLESGSSDEGSPRKRRKIEKTTATQKNTLDGWMKRS